MDRPLPEQASRPGPRGSGQAGKTLPRAPDRRQMDRMTSILAPVRRVTQPKVFGIERIPHRPVLFVGNHTRYGFLDLPLMMSELWTRRRIIVRGLGDHAHYAIPVWRDLLAMGGMVRGTRENVRALMRAGQSILVFPGGADEVFKARGQEYRLLWKERLGFARLAIEFAYPIVPFAAVGAEEMYQVLVDSRTPGAGQVSALIRRLVGLPLPPLVRGVGPTLLPRPERLYFWFGDPVDTSSYGAAGNDDAAARTVRDEVRAAVEEGIRTLRSEREHDPHRGLLPRLRHEEHELPELATADPDAWLVTRAFEALNEHGAASAGMGVPLGATDRPAATARREDLAGTRARPCASGTDRGRTRRHLGRTNRRPHDRRPGASRVRVATPIRVTRRPVPLRGPHRGRSGSDRVHAGIPRPRSSTSCHRRRSGRPAFNNLDGTDTHDTIPRLKSISRPRFSSPWVMHPLRSPAA